jgi:hypothetical protein
VFALEVESFKSGFGRDPLLVIPAGQHFCGCVFSCWPCLSFPEAACFFLVLRGMARVRLLLVDPIRELSLHGERHTTELGLLNHSNQTAAK